MKLFCDLLKEAIKKQNWSQNYIAETFRINRGTLYKYYGGKTMPPEKFRKVFEAMSLPAPERKALCDAYYRESLGADRFQKIKYIENAVSSLDRSLQDTGSISTEKDGARLKDLSIDVVLPLRSEQEILDVVQEIFAAAAPGKIYTNYPYAFRRMDDILFQNITARQGFAVLHMLLFDTKNDGISNLDNLFSSLRWLAYQVNPVRRYADNMCTAFLPYPYFFALEPYCLLFDAQGSRGVLVKNEQTYNAILAASAAFEQGGERLASMPQDMVETKQDIGRAVSNGVKYCVCGYPCLSPIADREFIHAVAKRAVPGMGALMDIAVEHYGKLMLSNEEKFVVSAHGLRRFAETGWIMEVPAALVSPAPTEQRIRYFKQMETLIEQKRLLILDDISFSLPESISMDFFTDVLQIDGQFMNVEQSYRCNGNYILSVEDLSLMRDILDFVAYIRDNKFFYPSAGAKSFLNSMISLCENAK